MTDETCMHTHTDDDKQGWQEGGGGQKKGEGDLHLL